MFPRIILHNAISLDGRIDGFQVDIGLFYGLAKSWNEDATLAGCDTLLAAFENEKQPDSDSDPESNDDVATGHETRPLLVVPDSRGRLRHWRALLGAPYWRGGIALCSHATPVEYVEFLYANDIDCIVWGKDKVNLRKCLAELAERHEVRTIRVDSGGALAGALLREGLVDEISLLVHPVVVSSASARFLFRIPDPSAPDESPPLRLMHLERLEGDLVWMRYETIR